MKVNSKDIDLHNKLEEKESGMNRQVSSRVLKIDEMRSKGYQKRVAQLVKSKLKSEFCFNN